MALYDLTEFASFIQRDVDGATATLLRTLVTGAIEVEAGLVFTDPVPASVKAVALAAAARLYRNPSGVDSESLGGQSVGYGLTSLLRDDEKRIVRSANPTRSGFYSVPLSTPADVSYPYVA